jgi:DNA modification methylase
MLVKTQPFRVHESILVFYRQQPTYNPQMTYGHDTYSGFHDDSKSIGDVYGNGLVSRHKENTDGSRYPRSVQRFPQSRGGHPTQKPIELEQWLIRTYSNPGDTVLDNTMGSGTTGVAAVIEGRAFIGIEINTKYYNQAKARIEEIAHEQHN